MPLVSSCPKCDAPVLVPDGVDPSAKAKCPLCEEQFELQESLADLPPMLEILDQPNRPARPLVSALPADSKEADGDLMFGDLTDAGDHSGSGFGGLDFEEVGSGDFSENDSGADTNPLDTDSGTSPSGSTAASLASMSRPKKKKGPGAIVQIAGIAGFGILGLMIGYMILLKIKGAQGDFLKIGKYMPSFIYSADKSGSSNHQPEVIVRKEKNKSNKNGNGKKDKRNNNEDELPELGFDFGDSEKKKNRKKPKRNGNSGGPKPNEKPVGPTALEQTLRHNIESALDEVAVKAAKLAAMQEANKEAKADDNGKINDLGRAERDHYFSLAHLGLTLASAKQGSLNDKLTDRIAQYVDNAVSNLDSRDGIGEKAAIWINYEQTKDDDGNVVRKGRQGRDGVLIAGFVERAFINSEQIGVFQARVKIDGGDEVITIVGPGNPPAVKSPILLLGAIISDPTKNLADYRGEEEKVVWMALNVKLPNQGDQPAETDPDETEEKPDVDSDFDFNDAKEKLDSLDFPKPVLPAEPTSPKLPVSPVLP